jgi:hypothetical protein
MALYLFAGIPVSDYAAALAWYERLLGSPPSSFPNDTAFRPSRHAIYLVSR